MIAFEIIFFTYALIGRKMWNDDLPTIERNILLHSIYQKEAKNHHRVNASVRRTCNMNMVTKNNVAVFKHTELIKGMRVEASYISVHT